MLEFDGKRNPARRKAAEKGMVTFVMPDGKPGGGVPKPYVKTVVTYAVQVGVPFKVDTVEGVGQEGKAGDYLAIGLSGEMYPIDKVIFEKSYEEVWDVDQSL